MKPDSKSPYYVGQVVKAVAARYEKAMTEPPKRYTEDSLIADMLAAHKFAVNEQERAILKETEGLGTSRTRAATIESLIKGGFLISTKKKKLYELKSSEMSRVTISRLPDVLTSVATTAKWEVAFKMIERGSATPDQVRLALKTNLDHIVRVAKETGRIDVSGGSGATSARFARMAPPSQKTAAKTPPAAAKPLPVKKAATGAAKGASSWFR